MSEKTHKPVYDRNRFPKQLAPGICRDCHGPITNPRRKTWCKDECKHRYHPRWVKRAVVARDKHICQICGLDIGEELRNWRRMKPVYVGSFSPAMRAWRKAKPREEHDHIVPFSEGGATLVENMRTLCEACHKQRTADWRSQKSKKGKV